MQRHNWKQLFIAAGFVLAGSIALLWSWNTLAALFGGPQAELRHVLSFLIIAFTARTIIMRGRRGHQPWRG